MFVSEATSLLKIGMFEVFAHFGPFNLFSNKIYDVGCMLRSVSSALG